ncbi:MAG: hypothetical protein SFZ24_08130 [Planctomycetota bacterium]|nr:hypothetical protein [Planctomycetota bacterium]
MRRSILLLAAAFGLSPPAVVDAAAPRVLDIIDPQAVAAVLAVDNVSALDRKARDFLAAVGGPDFGGLAFILDAMGLSRGLDLEGSLAILLPGAAAPAQPARPLAWGDLVVLAPVRDAAAFFASVNARGEGDLRSFEYSGDRVFVRPFGPSHIALGGRDDLVAALRPATGALPRTLEDLGPLGAAVAEESDIVLLGEIRPILAMLRDLTRAARGAGPGLPPAADQPSGDNPAQQPAEPGDAAALVQGSFAGRLGRVFIDESRASIVGLTFAPLALRVDVASGFAPESMLRAATSAHAEGAPARSGLALLARNPYVLALALDAAHPTVRMIADELAPPRRARGVLAEAEYAILGSIDSMDAAAVAVYAPPSLTFGVLSRTVAAWSSPTPDEGARAFESWIEGLTGKVLRAGAPALTTAYRESAATIAERPADTWSITAPPGMGPLTIAYGAHPSIDGVLVRAPDYAHLTWSRDAALVEASVRAPAGPQDASLAGDELLTQVRALLPEPRFAEAFADVSPVLSQLGPLMRMFAGGPGGGPGDLLADVPEQLPPLGAALTARDGSARATIIVPTPLVQLGVQLYQRVSENQPEPAP